MKVQQLFLSSTGYTIVSLAVATIDTASLAGQCPLSWTLPHLRQQSFEFEYGHELVLTGCSGLLLLSAIGLDVFLCLGGNLLQISCNSLDSTPFPLFSIVCCSCTASHWWTSFFARSRVRSGSICFLSERDASRIPSPNRSPIICSLSLKSQLSARVYRSIM